VAGLAARICLRHVDALLGTKFEGLLEPDALAPKLTFAAFDFQHSSPLKLLVSLCPLMKWQGVVGVEPTSSKSNLAREAAQASHHYRCHLRIVLGYEDNNYTPIDSEHRQCRTQGESYKDTGRSLHVDPVLKCGHGDPRKSVPSLVKVPTVPPLYLMGS